MPPDPPLSRNAGARCEGLISFCCAFFTRREGRLNRGGRPVSVNNGLILPIVKLAPTLARERYGLLAATYSDGIVPAGGREGEVI